ncbi:MAG: hypothetical protein DMF73_04090 [Acidobacteria bacterium]|nr:MAG: hypothetical protein DMF73_04090 [Acidobacteriota bacterium]
MAFRFEWDEHKARLNRGKHGVTFDEASSVFDDLLAKIFDDESHSGEERREIIVGHSIKRRLLLVCFVERPNERIRIVSARLPTSQERQAYEENI